MNAQRKSRKSSQLKQEEKLKKMDEQKISESRPKVSKKGITRLTVAGFKSISQEQSIEIRPLTILAGANSSGKTSIMQPLLLLKQTLEASYDPGALRLDGPNVRFTSAKQFLSHTSQGKHTDGFSVGIYGRHGYGLITAFKK